MSVYKVNFNFNSLEFKDALRNIENQLSNGYLDLSSGPMDDNEMCIIEESIRLFKEKHIEKGVWLTVEKEFTVRIEEKRSKDVTIKAVTIEEAIDAIEDLYSSGDIFTTTDDVEDTEFFGYEED